MQADSALQPRSSRTQRILSRLRKHNVAVASSGREDLVLFPSYARRTSCGSVEVDVKGLLTSPGLPSWRSRMILLSARKIMGIRKDLERDTSRASTPLSRQSTGSSIASDDGDSGPSLPCRMSEDSTLSLRLAPFMSQPVANRILHMTLHSEAGTVDSAEILTTSTGHFQKRIRTSATPTAVTISADKGLCLNEPIKIEESKGISLISDIDDTIKHSAIYLGAKEVFRNTFLRELSKLEVEGVRNWYTTLQKMGVSIHYVSSSPWQLYPLLKEFLYVSGLPHGSFHLKYYTGVLQGIFEPVAGRKRHSIESVVRDFPDRKFVLVGDSGEMDLEVYTDVALLYPKQIIAIYIRDVTTSGTQFFDVSMEHGSAPPLPPRRIRSEDIPRNSGSSTPDLISFQSDDDSAPEAGLEHELPALTRLKSPPVPRKPDNLRSMPVHPPKRPLSASSLKGSVDVNKKVELWNARLFKAREALSHCSIPIKTWKKGSDVEADCIALVRKNMG